MPVKQVEVVEKLNRYPPPSPAALWIVNVLKKNLRVGLFLAVFNAFFHLVWSCTIFDPYSLNEGLHSRTLSMFCVVYFCPDNRLLHLGCNDLSISQPAFICSKLKKETLEQDVKYVQSWCRRSGIFIVNLTYFKPCSSVSFVNFEQVNVGLVLTSL